MAHNRGLQLPRVSGASNGVLITIYLRDNGVVKDGYFFISASSDLSAICKNGVSDVHRRLGDGSGGELLSAGGVSLKVFVDSSLKSACGLCFLSWLNGGSVSGLPQTEKAGQG